MSVNSNLIHRVLDKIESEPESWDQCSWVNECGTTQCFAGWALSLTGYVLESRNMWTGEHVSEDSMSAMPTFVSSVTNKPVDCVGDVAMEILGLTETQAWAIFSYGVGRGPYVGPTPGASPADMRKRVAEVLDDPQYLNSRDPKADS